MKLQDAPIASVVRITGEPHFPPLAYPVKEGDVVTVYSNDGVFVFCRMEDGRICHIAGSTEVEVNKRQ